ncbi:MAG TPA: hypothetical protein VIL97_08055 [Thermoanaerobaculia bacterium]
MRIHRRIVWIASMLTLAAAFAVAEPWDAPRIVRIERTIVETETDEGRAQTEVAGSKTEEGNADEELSTEVDGAQDDVVRTADTVEAANWPWPAWVSLKHLLLRDGDYVHVSRSTRELLIPYAASDGMELKIAATEWGEQFDDRTVAVSLNQPEAVAWLAAADEEELASLRSVEFPNDLDEVPESALRRLAVANPNLAVSVSSWSALLGILSLFEPSAVFVNGDEDPAARAAAFEILAKQNRIHTLVISANVEGSLDSLPALGRLTHLVIGEWDVENAGPLPPGITGLKSLTVMFDDDIEDLSSLRNAPAGLQELSVMGGSFLDLSELARLQELSVLRFMLTGKRAVDISSLEVLGKLRWLGLPPGIAQDQFANVLKTHPALEILELVGAEHIVDLAPLAAMKHLTTVALDKTHRNLASLHGIRSLRAIGVPQETLDELPEEIKTLRESVPDALIVVAEPFCLGSGWILLLALLVALVGFFQRRVSAGVDRMSP